MMVRVNEKSAFKTNISLLMEMLSTDDEAW